jgi:F-type H+-transporting ATPase subunit alpha
MENVPMEIKVEEISRIIRKQIEDYDRQVEVSETGTVVSAGDGIARVYGLEKAMAGELLEFPHGVLGMTLNLEEDNVGAALFGDATHQRGRRGPPHRPHRGRARSARRCSAAS